MNLAITLFCTLAGITACLGDIPSYISMRHLGSVGVASHKPNAPKLLISLDEPLRRTLNEPGWDLPASAAESKIFLYLELNTSSANEPPEPDDIVIYSLSLRACSRVELKVGEAKRWGYVAIWESSRKLGQCKSDVLESTLKKTVPLLTKEFLQRYSSDNR